VNFIIAINYPALELYPLSLSVAKGSDVQLECCIETDTVIWHVQTQDALYTTITNSSLLNFSNITEADSGKYQCSINAGGEEIQSHSATITVFSKFIC